MRDGVTPWGSAVGVRENNSASKRGFNSNAGNFQWVLAKAKAD